MTLTPTLYRVHFNDLAGHRIHVSLHINAPNPNGQTLFLPAWIPGSYLIRDFSRQVERISAESKGKPVTITKTNNHTWHCEPVNGPLTVSYVIYAWDLSVRSAHVDETHAFFNGTSVFLGVAGQEDQPCLVDIVEPAHTKDWKVYTSMPEAKNHPQAALRHGFGVYEVPNYDALIDHPFELGTPQVISFKAHGALHEMVFTGIVPNLDLQRIADDTQKICEAQIEFFEPETKAVPFLDSSDRYVFMTMVTGDDYGGLEHRSSTALVASRRDLPTLNQKNTEKSEGYLSFLGLVSHEYFHTWNVKRIKPAAFAPYRYLEENHTQLLWVFEGFTSYYDDLMLLRANVIDQCTYHSLLAKNINAVQRQLGRFKQSTAESSFDTWTRFYKQDENSTNALVSYYSKGALVALALDLHLREHSDNQKSLDDVMRLMWERYGRDFYRGKPLGIAEDEMPSLVLEATGIEASEVITRYAYGRDELPLQQLLSTQGISLVWKESNPLPSFDVRWRARANEGLEIATVHEYGAAHKAGLSAGDLLIAIDGLRVSNETTLKQLLGAYNAGDTVTVHVFRRDELRSFTLSLAPSPKDSCSLSVLPS